MDVGGGKDLIDEPAVVQGALVAVGEAPQQQLTCSVSFGGAKLAQGSHAQAELAHAAVGNGGRL
jgi:hypothetical protein